MNRAFTLCQYILDTHLSKIADVFSMACISSSGSCSLLFTLSPLCFRPSDLSVKHYIRLQKPGIPHLAEVRH